MRVSRVTGPSSFARAMAKHPAECAVPSPTRGDLAAAFRVHNPLGTRNERCFVADVHGPHARAPTLRRLRCRGRRKARFRLGGLTLGRTGFAPARRLLESFVKLSHRFSPLRPALPGRTMHQRHVHPAAEAAHGSPYRAAVSLDTGGRDDLLRNSLTSVRRVCTLGPLIR